MIGVIESEPNVIIKIESEFGTKSIQDAQEHLEQLLQLEELAPVEDIKEALRIADEGTDESNADRGFVERYLEITKGKQPQKMKKAELVTLVKNLREAWELSGVEY